VRSLGISWLEPPASRCCTALHTDNSLPDRSNSTRFGWRKADFNRSSHNLDKSPTTDNHSTSTPVRERPTTSRSARHASHGTSGPRARSRSHCASPRSRRGTRLRESRPHGTRRCGIRRRGSLHRGNPLRRRALRRRALRGRDLARRGLPRPAMQLRCSPRADFCQGGPLLLRNSASSNSSLHLAAQGTQATRPAFLSGYVPLTPAAPITLSKFW
jgi:hypothetical protein